MMGLVRLALRRPYTIAIISLLILFLGYLAMTRMTRGLLINFGGKSLEFKRRVL